MPTEPRRRRRRTLVARPRIDDPASVCGRFSRTWGHRGFQDFRFSKELLERANWLSRAWVGEGAFWPLPYTYARSRLTGCYPWRGKCYTLPRGYARGRARLGQARANEREIPRKKVMADFCNRLCFRFAPRFRFLPSFFSRAARGIALWGRCRV
jgi:hypothetical protein